MPGRGESRAASLAWPAIKDLASVQDSRADGVFRVDETRTMPLCRGESPACINWAGQPGPLPPASGIRWRTRRRAQPSTAPGPGGLSPESSAAGAGLGEAAPAASLSQ